MLAPLLHDPVFGRGMPPGRDVFRLDADDSLTTGRDTILEHRLRLRRLRRTYCFFPVDNGTVGLP
jgi:hypothetical protein